MGQTLPHSLQLHSHEPCTKLSSGVKKPFDPAVERRLQHVGRADLHTLTAPAAKGEETPLGPGPRGADQPRITGGPRTADVGEEAPQQRQPARGEQRPAARIVRRRDRDAPVGGHAARRHRETLTPQAPAERDRALGAGAGALEPQLAPGRVGGLGVGADSAQGAGPLAPAAAGAGPGVDDTPEEAPPAELTEECPQGAEVAAPQAPLQEREAQHRHQHGQRQELEFERQRADRDQPAGEHARDRVDHTPQRRKQVQQVAPEPQQPVQPRVEEQRAAPSQEHKWIEHEKGPAPEEQQTEATDQDEDGRSPQPRDPAVGALVGARITAARPAPTLTGRRSPRTEEFDDRPHRADVAAERSTQHERQEQQRDGE